MRSGKGLATLRTLSLAVETKQAKDDLKSLLGNDLDNKLRTLTDRL